MWHNVLLDNQAHLRDDLEIVRTNIVGGRPCLTVCVRLKPQTGFPVECLRSQDQYTSSLVEITDADLLSS